MTKAVGVSFWSETEADTGRNYVWRSAKRINLKLRCILNEPGTNWGDPWHGGRKAS
jgi:hypothetical protein